MSAIDEFQAWLEKSIPEEFKNYAETTGAEEINVNRVLLYSAEDLIERNETYEVKEYCPGYFTIGDDGGGGAIVMKVEDGSLHLVDHGAMMPDCMKLVADSFQEWHASGCPLPDED